MKVFVHWKNEKGEEWHNEGRDFKQVPSVGEYFTLSWDSEWYEVGVVVHCPFDADYDAEIYAMKADRTAILKPFTKTAMPAPKVVKR